MSIRILQLVRSLDVGGLETVVAGLMDQLGAPDYECYLGCLIEEGRWGESVNARGRWIGHLEDKGRLSTILSLRRYLKREKIDVIHSHNPMPHFYGALASVLTGIPLIHTKHGVNYPKDRAFVRRSRLWSRVTKKIVAVSEDVARVVRDIERVPSEKVVVVRNGVDANRGQGSGVRGQERTDARRQLGLEEDSLVIGSVGRLSPEKNYPLLVKAFALAKQEAVTPTPPYPHTPILAVIGPGPERDKLEALVAELDLGDSVILAGEQQDVSPWLQAMDVFCLPSNTEGTSISLLEAGACGLPLVATNVGGNSEIIEDGVSGIIVPPGDEQALTAAILRLMDDENLRATMGKAAQKRVRTNYSLDQTVTEYKKLYEQVTANRIKQEGREGREEPQPPPRGTTDEADQHG